MFRQISDNSRCCANSTYYMWSYIGLSYSCKDSAGSSLFGVINNFKWNGNNKAIDCSEKFPITPDVVQSVFIANGHAYPRKNSAESYLTFYCLIHFKNKDCNSQTVYKVETENYAACQTMCYNLLEAWVLNAFDVSLDLFIG